MNNTISTVMLLGATLVLVGILVFGGVFDTAKSQHTKSQSISNTTTIPTTLP